MVERHPHPPETEEEAWLHCTLDGQPVSASDRLLELLGFESESQLCDSVPRVHDLYGDRSDRSQLREPLAESLPSDEVRWLRRDGTSLWVRLVAEPIPRLEGIFDPVRAGGATGAGGRGMTPGTVGEDILEVRVVDVTGRRHLERQLRHAQKMEALGQLAGGMANDLGNLLTATLAHLDLLDEALAEGDAGRAQGELREIRRGATTSAQMVKHLLSFSKGERLRLREVGLRELVQDSMRLLRPLIPPGVTLRTHEEPAPPVLADPAAVEKLLLALVTNALAAMHEGGEIHIAVGTGRFNEEHLSRAGWGDRQEYGVITVTDTGEGMSPQTVARLFQPFFSGTEDSEELGLSMSMVYGLMKQHRGFVQAESEPGKGTTVKLFFRLSESRVRAEGVEGDRVGAGRETILFVEDDENLRSVSCRILRAHGYRVLEAGDGAAALEVIASEGTPDLLITDLVMPSVSGMELVEALEKRPDPPRILLTSGFRPEFLLGWGVEPGSYPFLEKPWQIETLVGEVRAVIGGRQGPGRREEPGEA
jgi:two-component system, cell cycle sensor histidine kinase and response regulator CckA